MKQVVHVEALAFRRTLFRPVDPRLIQLQWLQRVHSLSISYCDIKDAELSLLSQHAPQVWRRLRQSIA